MNFNDVSTDVLIVGAGPAGLVTAVALARSGVRPLVVERHPGTSPFPKATGISTRTMEILRAWGLEEALRAGALSVQVGSAFVPTLAEQPTRIVQFGYPDEETARRHTPTTPVAAPQDHLEPLLLAQLRELGGAVRFGTELTGLTTGGDGATATVADRLTGETARIRARYVVGADGPASRVRAALGIGLEDLGSLGDHVTVYFRADLSAIVPEPWTVYGIESQEGNSLLVPVDRAGRWVYARQCGDGSGDCTAQDWPALIRGATGVPGLEPEIQAVLPFTMAAALACTFRAGNAFLVGDAAHRMTPVGGVGMNSAIQAAHNLGWKLGWVVRGWAGEALLDSYEPERRPIGRANAYRSTHPEEFEDFDGLAFELSARYESPAIDASGAGTRAPHRWLQPGVSTIDRFEGRLTLLTGRLGSGWRRGRPARGHRPADRGAGARPRLARPRRPARPRARRRPRRCRARAPRRLPLLARRGVLRRSRGRARRRARDDARPPGAPAGAVLTEHHAPLTSDSFTYKIFFAVRSVLYLEEIEQAEALLKPQRIEVLRQLAEPRSCTEVGHRLDQTPQRVYYHVKRLVDAGLVRQVADRRVRGITEGIYQAAARSYWLSPALVGRIGRGARDELSLGHLLDLVEEVQSDVAALDRTAPDLPSIGISGEIRVRPEERQAFLDELGSTLQDLFTRYGGAEGDAFRLAVACYPKGDRDE
jgi:2-polyprenyl-6-methoxyphenol hydroxylase-like FAD-dependent oxidoreductase/DNA-binding transcriptional ArsR family regulator